jgi:hypothetical protein
MDKYRIVGWEITTTDTDGHIEQQTKPIPLKRGGFGADPKQLLLEVVSGFSNDYPQVSERLCLKPDGSEGYNSSEVIVPMISLQRRVGILPVFRTVHEESIPQFVNDFE